MLNVSRLLKIKKALILLYYSRGRAIENVTSIIYQDEKLETGMKEKC